MSIKDRQKCDGKCSLESSLAEFWLMYKLLTICLECFSVDETVKNPRSGQGDQQMGGMPGGMGRGRGRPM